ncbi:hypothetical protein BGX23_001638 [Mortierella sp. AD031]|nr:hypothetical protein BGX23_001638 [Mortierella sp. AD031]
MARLNINSPSTSTASTATNSKNRVPPTTSRHKSLSRSYSSQDYDNPFQESSSSSFVTAAAAPVPSDTIASSPASFSSARPVVSTASTLPRITQLNSNKSSTTGPSTATVSMTTTNMTTTTTMMNHQSSSTTYRGRESDLKTTGQSRQESRDGQERDYAGDEEDEGDLDHHGENPLIHLTRNQREAAIENLEIETMDRIQKLRASIGVLTNSLKFRAEAEMNRLPAAIRAMTVEEFWFTYNGSAKDYLEQQAKSKTVANTAFLHALGMVDHQKRKREATAPPADDLWQQKKRNREEQHEQHQRPTHSAGFNGSSSTSHRPLHQSTRHNPYSSQHRRVQNPFVDSRSARGHSRE